MRLLVADFETKDPHLRKNGQGPYLAINYPGYEFTVLLVAYMTEDGDCGATTDWSKLQHMLDTHDAIIGHNLMYDIGCLLYLNSVGAINFKLGTHIYYDTMIMAKLYNQNFYAYGLDYLGGILAGAKKESSLLHEFAWSTGIYQDSHKQVTGRNCKTRPSEAVLEKWCKTNMDAFPVEVLSQYAVQDVVVTRKLYDKLVDKLDYLDLSEYSTDLEITVDMKVRGVDIDLEQCHKVSAQFGQWSDEAAEKVYEHLGKRIELGKIQKQLAPALVELGYSIPRTDKGNYSVTDAWLEDQVGDVFEQIRTYRKALQKKRNFIDKIINYQQAIPEQYRDAKRGRLHPTLKLLGAHVTGRYSSGGGSGSLEVSVHQIPVRDEVFGKPCRSIFIPYKDETWVAGDFNSQESRLQVHYACLLGCDGADVIRDMWIADPHMSYHDTTAKITGLERAYAKTINLGLSYGMGEEKLTVQMGVSAMRGKAIIDQYHEMFPFMKQLQKACSASLKQHKYVKTISGNRLVIGKRGPDNRNPEKDGLSKVIQGSAARQCAAAMRAAYKAGMKILIVVHDEINISTPNPDEDVLNLQDCMQNAIQLCLPAVADVNSGHNWLEAK